MMILPKYQGIRPAARAVTLVLAASLLSTISPTSADGAEGFGAGVTIDRQDETGTIGFIGTSRGKPIDSGLSAGTPVATVATSFLHAHATRLGLAATGTGLRVTDQHANPGGLSTVRVAQTYAGIPVLGGGFTVNLDADHNILSVLGEASPITSAATKATVSAAAASATAVASVARDTETPAAALRASTPELSFFDPRLLGAPSPYQVARLAWVSEVRGTGRTSDLGQKVIVDAASGTVALAFDTIAHAKNRTVCDAVSTTAQYPCVSPVWTEGVTPATGNADIPAAYNYAGDTYDFFFTRFGRDSLNGAGLQLKSTVDYCPSPADCPYQNAFWDGAQMVYGDGFASADDVVGHELTHGVTDFSSSLFYYQQSGAINESMSDVFGEFIDQVNGAGNDTPAVKWQLGEDIPGFGAIRNMANPPAFNDPDRMLSPLFAADPNEGDGGGVHSNSGVNNKAAFLMVDGGTFNGQTITGLGITKAARIFYTVDNSMLVSGSDYADLANALRQACTNLIGTDSINAADCAEVNKVVLATEMDQNPTNSPTATTTLCPAGSTVASTVLADNLETNTGQFTTAATTGGNGWNYPQNPNPFGLDATYATSGATNIWGYDRPAISDSHIRMTNAVAIPANAYLHFNHAYGFEDGTSAAYDGGVVEFSTGGAGGPWVDAGSLFSGPGGANGYTGTIDPGFGNPLGGRSAFVRESNGYGSSRVNLTSLAGQNAMFRWRLGTDSSQDDYGWFLDDITISTCTAPDTTPPDTSITSGPADGSTITSSTATFAFASSEAGSTFRCQVDAGGYAACTSPKTTAALANGAHTFSVAAVDAANNVDPTPATRSFTLAVPDTTPPDTTPPDTSITSGPADGSTITSSTATFAFASSEAGSTFRCQVDAGGYAACTSPRTTAALANGAHTFSVAAVDAVNNVDPTPATRSFTVAVPGPPPDTTAPQTTIRKGPKARTSSHKAKFVFSSNEAGVTFMCKLDKKAYKPCTSPKKYKVKVGKHTFRVYATDASGNIDATPAVWKWKVKRT